MQTLEEMYFDRHMNGNKTICHHMPVLRSLASEVDSCVEFGVRTGNSSIALLLGCPGKVTSYEIERMPEWHEPINEAAGGKWVVRYSRSEDAKPFTCGLLLHDSFHNYAQVERELRVWADHVTRYLVFHDSVKYALAGGEDHARGNFNPDLAGFRLAVDELMIRDKTWTIKAHYPESDGLLVLERVR